MAHLTNFSFEFFYEIFTEDASLLLLYEGAKRSKVTKNSNQGGPAKYRISRGMLFDMTTWYVVTFSRHLFKLTFLAYISLHLIRAVFVDHCWLEEFLFGT